MVRLGIAMCACAVLVAGSAAARDNIQASVYAERGAVDGGCAQDVSFSGLISVPLSGEVEYRFVRSDGAIEPSQKLLFEKPGMLPVGMSWHVPGKVRDYRGWVAVEVLEPVHLQSAPARFRTRCGHGDSQHAGFHGGRGSENVLPFSGHDGGPAVISLGPKDNPYVKWNGERIGGTPALEARLREYRAIESSCEVRVAPDRHADYQMLASVLSVIQRTDECATVEVGLVGSLGKAKGLIEAAAFVSHDPLITIGGNSDGAVRWNDEEIAGPGALEQHLSEYRRNHDDCQVGISDKRADQQTVTDVLSVLVRTGCTLALDGPPEAASHR